MMEVYKSASRLCVNVHSDFLHEDVSEGDNLRCDSGTHLNERLGSVELTSPEKVQRNCPL